LPSLQQNFTHTSCSSSSYIVTLSLIRRTACACAQIGGCSSVTNGHSETRQMAVCCQNLPLGALNSCSALHVPVGALFKKFGLYLNNHCTPEKHWIEEQQKTAIWGTAHILWKVVMSKYKTLNMRS